MVNDPDPDWLIHVYDPVNENGNLNPIHLDYISFLFPSPK